MTKYILIWFEITYNNIIINFINKNIKEGEVKKMEEIINELYEGKLIEVTVKELISYSKQKEVPSVTIIDDLTEEQNNYVSTIADRLNLLVILIKNSKKIAIIGNTQISKKIAKDLKRKAQVMFCDYAKRPSGSITIYALTGYTKNWTVLRDNGYVVIAYDEKGNETTEWINTDIKNVEPKTLNSLKLSKYGITIGIRGIHHSGNTQILKHSRQNYINDGIYNENRKCYYPKDRTNNKNIAEYNKLEKMFKKWGFKSLY